MTFVMSPIAVSVSPDHTTVARFGHDHPLVAIDAAGKRSLRQAEGCCGHLAKAVADCEIVICTAIGQGAAGHLAQAGVRLAVVPVGTAVEEALRRFRAGELVGGGGPSACDHGHGHDEGHCHGGASGPLKPG